MAFVFTLIFVLSFLGICYYNLIQEIDEKYLKSHGWECFDSVNKNYKLKLNDSGNFLSFFYVGTDKEQLHFYLDNEWIDLFYYFGYEEKRLKQIKLLKIIKITKKVL